MEIGALNVCDTHLCNPSLPPMTFRIPKIVRKIRERERKNELFQTFESITKWSKEIVWELHTHTHTHNGHGVDTKLEMMSGNHEKGRANIPRFATEMVGFCGRFSVSKCAIYTFILLFFAVTQTHTHTAFIKCLVAAVSSILSNVSFGSRYL